MAIDIIIAPRGRATWGSRSSAFSDRFFIVLDTENSCARASTSTVVSIIVCLEGMQDSYRHQQKQERDLFAHKPEKSVQKPDDL